MSEMSSGAANFLLCLHSPHEFSQGSFERILVMKASKRILKRRQRINAENRNFNKLRKKNQ